MAPTRERHVNPVRSPSGRLLVVNLTKLIACASSWSWQSRLAIDLKDYGQIGLVSTAFESINNIVCAFTGRMDMPSKLNSLTTTKVISRRNKGSQRQVASAENINAAYGRPLESSDGRRRRLSVRGSEGGVSSASRIAARDKLDKPLA